MVGRVVGISTKTSEVWDLVERLLDEDETLFDEDGLLDDDLLGADLLDDDPIHCLM